ncbi:MAG: SRPBCC family protein [Cyanobacteria bacterium P01_F01_bin.42]
MINPSVSVQATAVLSDADTVRLRHGEVLVKTRPHTVCGGALDAKLYLPVVRSRVWEQLTDYSLWTGFFPDVTQSRIIDGQQPQLGKRLYQAAEKSFLFITAQVNLYLKVFEIEQQHIRFQFEKGSFSDFTADLTLSDMGEGTLLHYSVSATPLIPVPSFFIEQAMKMDLPVNLRHMRQKICDG